MAKVLILNGSPRAAKSNSKIYSEIFIKKFPGQVDYFNITKFNHDQLITQINKENYDDILFVFPLYADGIPVTLLNFLKKLELENLENKPTISVMINCGFFEPKQNDIAIRMMKVFAKINNYKYGSTMRIASGEATPTLSIYKYLLSNKIKKFAVALYNKKYKDYTYTMLITKKLFLKASTIYWTNYGKKNGISKLEMSTMKIEDK